MTVNAQLRAEIEAAHADWGWHLDHKEFDEMIALYAEDARFVPSAGVELIGHDAIRGRYSARAGVRTTRHLFSGVRIQEISETSVRVWSTWATYGANEAIPVPSAATYLVAEFEDVFVRADDGRWLIADRTITSVFRDAGLGPVTR